MKLGDNVPAFDDHIEWIDGVKHQPHPGRPLLVHFWSTGCPLCHEGAARIGRWRSKHGADALDVIAVFSPRPESPLVDVDVVRRDARESMMLEGPCAIDRNRELQSVFDCPFAPGYFVFDRDGKLRHRQMGNDALANIGALLDRLAVKASSSEEA